MENKQKAFYKLEMALIWALLLLLLLSAATFAWISYNPFTNVTPIASTVSEGGVALQISISENGPFDKQCDLIYVGDGDLSPVSTVNLENFYEAGYESPEGIITSFLPATDLENKVIHGTLYLTSLSKSCDVYFNRTRLMISDDIQALAGLRLGLKIGNQTYLLEMQHYDDITQANEHETVAMPYSVCDANGQLVNDPAIDIIKYCGYENGDSVDVPQDRTPLITIEANTVVKAEYWLYLEGCDKNTFNDIQKRDVHFSLAFLGTLPRN